MLGNPFGYDIGGVTLLDAVPVVPYRSTVTLDDVSAGAAPTSLVEWSGFVITPTQADADQITFLQTWAQ